MAIRMNADEISAMLAGMPEWTLMSGREAIARRITFKDFKSAFAFMNDVAAQAERLDHHPEWTNVWNRVDIVLTTHSAKGVTELDQKLAEFINLAAEQHGAKPNQ